MFRIPFPTWNKEPKEIQHKSVKYTELQQQQQNTPTTFLHGVLYLSCTYMSHL